LSINFDLNNEINDDNLLSNLNINNEIKNTHTNFNDNEINNDNVNVSETISNDESKNNEENNNNDKDADNESIVYHLNKTFDNLNVKNKIIGVSPNESNTLNILNKSFLIKTIKNKPLIPIIIKNNKDKVSNKMKNKSRELINQDLDFARKENEVLKKKNVELEYIIKSLNEKLFEKDKKLQEDKEKSLQDIAFKEEKIQNLANLIGDLEDENYRLKHLGKDNMTKAKIIMMEKQITTFATEFQKKDQKNKELENKVKQQEAQINKLSKENKMLQNNLEFLNNNLNSLQSNNDIFSSSRINDNADPFNRRRRRNTLFEGNSFLEGDSILDPSSRFVKNKMMKFIKGGTKTNGGFFSKIMENKQDTMKLINDFKGQVMNNKDFMMEQLKNQLKQLDNDVLNSTQSEFG
jgi:hypothetical protein